MSLVSFIIPEPGVKFCNMYGVLTGILPDSTPLIGVNEKLSVSVVQIEFDFMNPGVPEHFTVGLSIYYNFNELLHERMVSSCVRDESIGFQSVSLAPVRGMSNRYPLRCHSLEAANELADKLRNRLPVMHLSEMECLFIESEGELHPVLLADRDTLIFAQQTMSKVDVNSMQITGFEVVVLD